MFDYSYIFENFISIETDEIKLRQLTNNDAYDVFEMLSNPKVVRFDRLNAITKSEHAFLFINAANKSFENKIGMRFAIELKAINKAIGTCGFIVNKNDAWVRIGFQISEKFWHKGYGFKAIKLLVKFIFENTPSVRIEAYTLPQNVASSKLLEKLGFTNEGLIRNYMFFKQKHNTMLLYSLIK